MSKPGRILCFACVMSKQQGLLRVPSHRHVARSRKIGTVGESAALFADAGAAQLHYDAG